MKWSQVIATATCVFALAACEAGTDGNPQPTPTQPPALSTTQPTMSAEESKKAAAAEEAARKAHEKELRAWTASIEKAIKAQTSPFMKLGVIITEYCKFPYDAREFESEKVSILEKLYNANWQAGKWNKDLESASQQPGACPQPLPQMLPQTG